MITLHHIELAALHLQGQVLRTPCVESRTLSHITGAHVPEVREPAIHRFLQGTGGMQQTQPVDARGACDVQQVLRVLRADGFDADAV